MKNITFYSQSLCSGGAERVISNLANYLSHRYNVNIVVNTLDNIAYELDPSIKLFELDNKKIKNPLFRNVYRIKQTKKILPTLKSDIIVSFLPMPSLRVLLLRKYLKTKIIISDRNDPKVEYNNIFTKRLFSYLYSKADGVIFQTEEQKSFFPKKVRDKSNIIYNSLKEDFIIDLGGIEKENRIINVGRYENQKNQMLLIHSFGDIANQFPEYKLVIYGTGSLKEKLSLEIERMNLKSRISLCEPVKNIKQELYKSKIFVLSSDYEGMPNSLLEAMACGLACISTDCPCGGPREIINDENGILIPVSSQEELTKSLIRLLKDEDEMIKMGNKAKMVKNKFNPKEINKQWENFILKIASNGDINEK